MQEHWIRYTTDKLFEKKYYFDSLEYQDKTLTIILNDPEIDSTYVYITFQDSVKGFRNTNESYAYQVIDILTDLYGADFYGDRTFFNIFYSDYLHSFENHESLLHFNLIPVDWIIDVIATAQPTMTLVERKQ